MERLNKSFTHEEIRNAAFQIGAHKTPGIDEKPEVFFQHYLDIVRPLTIKAISGFLKSSFLLKKFNKKMIALVPKTDVLLRSHTFDLLVCALPHTRLLQSQYSLL